MKNVLLSGLVLSACTALAGCSGQSVLPTTTEAVAETAAAVIEAKPSSSMELALNGAWRSDAHKARDAERHPAETLAFFDVAADETVIELAPGGGWYTEVIAPYLNAGGGTYIAATGGDAERDAKFLEKFSDTDTFGEVNVGVLGGEGIAPGSADTVLTFRNLHNWMGDGGDSEVFANAFAALKPGGVFGVIEHRLPASAEQDPNGRTGYVHQDLSLIHI